MTKYKITGTEYNASKNADPSDHGVFDYEFEITSNSIDQKVFQLIGGPTSYESFTMHDETIAAMKECGWSACAGTPGSYNRLSFTADQMKAAFKQLDESLDLPSLEEVALEIEMAERDDKRNFVFCPLTNSMCRTDCEAYYPPRVETFPGLGDTPDEHSVTGGYCTASALHTQQV